LQPFNDLFGKELIHQLLASKEFCFAALSVCGFNICEVGERFWNPYQPNEERPSAYLYRTSDKRFEVRFFREEEGERKGTRVTLAQLYRDTHTGVVGAIKEGNTDINRRNVGGPESAVWIIRIAHETGFIELPPSQAQPLSPGVSDSTRAVHEGADLLNRCRRRYDFDNVSFPAAARFVMDWTGQSESEVASAKRWLVTRGYWIVIARGQPYQKGQRAQPTLYRFGLPDEIKIRERAARRKHRANEINEIDKHRSAAAQAAWELQENQSQPRYLPSSWENWQRQKGG
jgi:hypothetical protein